MCHAERRLRNLRCIYPDMPLKSGTSADPFRSRQIPRASAMLAFAGVPRDHDDMFARFQLLRQIVVKGAPCNDRNLTHSDMLIAQLVLVSSAPLVTAENFDLPQDHLVIAVTRHLSNKGILDRRISWPRSLFPVDVRPSPIHGKGIFATRDIKRGELLSLYPPDALAFSRPAVGNTSLQINQGNEARDAEVHAALRTHSLLLGEPGGVRVRIVGLPRFCEDPAYLAHMANDPIGYVSTKEAYKQLAATKGNAAFVNVVCALCVAIVATRPIQAGKEVLVPYSYGYWDGWNNSSATE